MSEEILQNLSQSDRNIILLDYYNEIQLQLYRKRPDLWLRDRFGEDLSLLFWDNHKEYEDHKWDGDRNPFWKMFRQIAVADKNKRFIGIESATSCGKTYVAARLVYWFLDCFQGSTVVTTAPTRQQLETVLWGEIRKAFPKFKKIRPKAEIYNSRIYPEGTGSMNFLDESELDDESLKGKWICYGKTAGVSSNEDSSVHFQGIHAEYLLILVEEAAGVNKSVMKAIENTATGDFNYVVALGNPNSVTDTLHTFCQYENVLDIRISALDHPNIVRNLSFIPGAVTESSILFRKKEYGENSLFFKSRIRGIAPTEGSHSLIKFEWIASCCIYKEEYRISGPIEKDVRSYNALGVDVANSEEGDKACLAWGKSNRLMELHEFACKNANDLALNTIYDRSWLMANNRNIYETSRISQYNISQERIGVDAVGVGVATINTYEEHNYRVTSLHGGQIVEALPMDDETNKPLYSFNSLRAQMYFTFAIECQRREFTIEISDQEIANELIKEAVTPKLITSGPSIAIESKDNIKKRLGHSPNKLDAAVYWNWMRKNRVAYTGGLPFM